MKEIPAANLTLAHLPEADSSLSELFQFALSFNGYDWAGSDQCHVLAERVEASWRKPTSSLKNFSMDELRNALFFEQRRDHFVSPDSSGNYDFMRAIVEEIRRRLTS